MGLRKDEALEFFFGERPVAEEYGLIEVGVQRHPPSFQLFLCLPVSPFEICRINSEAPCSFGTGGVIPSIREHYPSDIPKKCSYIAHLLIGGIICLRFASLLGKIRADSYALDCRSRGGERSVNCATQGLQTRTNAFREMQTQCGLAKPAQRL